MPTSAIWDKDHNVHLDVARSTHNTTDVHIRVYEYTSTHIPVGGLGGVVGPGEPMGAEYNIEQISW